MSLSRLKQLTTYVEPDEVKKIMKKRGERGVISWSAYLRILIADDLKSKNS